MLRSSGFVILFSPIIVTCLFLNSCTLRYAVTGDFEKDIKNLSTQLNQVQKNQADLSISMDTLNTTMTSLNEKLDDNKQRMSLLAQRMDDTQANLTQRMDILNKKFSPEVSSSITPPPSDLYRMAYSDYSRGKYDIAINGYRAYMDQYPDSELAGTAQYYLAECYFSKKQYDTAITEFDKLASKYPHNDFMPQAKFKKALSMIELDKPKDAKKILEYIIHQYPKSPEAAQSQEKLKSILSP